MTRRPQLANFANGRRRAPLYMDWRAGRNIGGGPVAVHTARDILGVYKNRKGMWIPVTASSE